MNNQSTQSNCELTLGCSSSSPSSYCSTSSSLASSPQQVLTLASMASKPIYINTISCSGSSSSTETSPIPYNSLSGYKQEDMDQQYDDLNNQTQHDDYLDSSSLSDDMETNNNVGRMESDHRGEVNNGSSGIGSSRSNRFFPDAVVDILNRWFYDNQDYPYPDDNMTNVLAKEANISAKQVRKWFANKRVRSNTCYKQTFRVNKKETKGRRQTVLEFFLNLLFLNLFLV
jgi:hypothetical protein